MRNVIHELKLYAHCLQGVKLYAHCYTGSFTHGVKLQA